MTPFAKGRRAVAQGARVGVGYGGQSGREEGREGGGGRVNLGRRLENGVLKVGYLELGVYHKVVFECLFKASSNIQYVIFQTIADTILYDS